MIGEGMGSGAGSVVDMKVDGGTMLPEIRARSHLNWVMWDLVLSIVQVG